MKGLVAGIPLALLVAGVQAQDIVNGKVGESID